MAGSERRRVSGAPLAAASSASPAPTVNAIVNSHCATSEHPEEHSCFSPNIAPRMVVVER